MLSKEVLKELLKVVGNYPGGLVILEENKPRFVILDYETYQKISAGRNIKVVPPPRPKRILVTGGAGYIGSHAARLLAEKGFEVTTLDNFSTGHREFVQGKLAEGDLADEKFLDQVFADGKFDAVMHFAASIEVEESVKDPLKYYRNNVTSGLNLLQAMVRHNVRDLIFSSTCAIYSDNAPLPMSEHSPFGPASPYAETKLIFENILKYFAEAYGVNSVSLRYFNASGASLDQSLGLLNLDPTHLIPSILNVAIGRKGVLTVYGNDYSTQDGTAVRDYIHVLDLAEAHFRALNYLFAHENSHPIVEAFNVGSGHGYSVLEILNAVCEYTGHMVRFEIGPRRMGDREKVIADNSKIKRVLGFETKYSDLKTIIESSWAWHKKAFGNS